MNVNASTLNNVFVEKTASAEGVNELELNTSTYIRRRLREKSFTRKIIPPEMLRKSDCQRAVSHAGLEKIVDIEPDASATIVSFTGKADHRYLRVDRAAVPFFTVETDRFETTEEELMSWEMPVTKVVEDIQVKEMQYAVDRNFIQAVNQAIWGDGGTGNAVPWTATNNFVDRDDIVPAMKLIDAGRLSVATMLMCKETYDDILTWDHADVGPLATEIVKDGYTYKTLMGHNVVVTVNNDLVRPGTIYFFTDPEFLGKFFILQEAKFYLEKKGRHINWWAWEDLGVAILNNAGISMLYASDLWSYDNLGTDDWLGAEVVP